MLKADKGGSQNTGQGDFDYPDTDQERQLRNEPGKVCVSGDSTKLFLHTACAAS